MPQRFAAVTSSHGGTLTTKRRGQSRLTGIDLARFIAILGMVMVHFGPNPVPDTTLGTIYEVSHGRASILFVLLAGIGITFLSRSTASTGAFTSTAHILARAAILLPLGLWLQTLDHGVLIILQFYAAYFVFGSLVERLPGVPLLMLAIAFALFGPILYESAVINRPEWFQARAPALGDPAEKILRDVIVSGYYPLITWAFPLTIGIWLGRQNLSRLAVRAGMMMAGMVMLIGTSFLARIGTSYQIFDLQLQMSNEPHSQNHLWIVGATGSALMVLSLSLLLVDLLPRILWPLIAAGQLALTIYVGHLLILHRYTNLLRQETVEAAIVSVGTFMTLAVIASTIWRMRFSRGPLETLFRIPSWLIRRV